MIAFIQVTNYIFDGAQLIICNPGNQKNEEQACSGHVSMERPVSEGC